MRADVLAYVEHHGPPTTTRCADHPWSRMDRGLRRHGCPKQSLVQEGPSIAMAMDDPKQSDRTGALGTALSLARTVRRAPRASDNNEMRRPSLVHDGPRIATTWMSKAIPGPRWTEDCDDMDVQSNPWSTMDRGLRRHGCPKQSARTDALGTALGLALTEKEIVIIELRGSAFHKP